MSHSSWRLRSRRLLGRSGRQGKVLDTGPGKTGQQGRLVGTFTSEVMLLKRVESSSQVVFGWKQKVAWQDIRGSRGESRNSSIWLR